MAATGGKLLYVGRGRLISMQEDLHATQQCSVDGIVVELCDPQVLPWYFLAAECTAGV